MNGKELKLTVIIEHGFDICLSPCGRNWVGEGACELFVLFLFSLRIFYFGGLNWPLKLEYLEFFGEEFGIGQYLEEKMENKVMEKVENNNGHA